MKILYLTFALFFLGAAVATGAPQDEAIHAKAIKGRVEFFYRGEKLTDAKLDQLCEASRKQKHDIKFQRDKMNSNEAVAVILREARCQGATHIGFTGIDQYN